MSEAPRAVDLEQLLAHREWVRRLARSLVIDENRADDVEQLTWLSAMQSPPRVGTRPRAWLGTVVRNWVRRGFRADTRRAHYEGDSPRPGAAPAPVDIVADAEEQTRLVRMVLALDEPYRTTLLLRFFEDLPPREVATRMNVPVSTVRTRVRRALERLRARMDDEHGGERRQWALALLPALRGRSPATLSGDGGAAGTIKEVAIVSTTKKSVAVLVGIALSLAIWSALSFDETPSQAGPADAASTEHSTGSTAHDEATADAPSRRRRSDATDGASAADPSDLEPGVSRRLTVRILGPGDGPVPGVALYLDGSASTESQWSDLQGEVHIDVPLATESVRIRLPSLELEPLTLTEDVTELRYDDLLPLEIVFVDQESGYPLAVTPHSPILFGDAAGARREFVWLSSAPLRRGGLADFAIGLDAPEGYVHPGNASLRRKGRVSRFADRVRATVPIPRELQLRVSVRRADGKAAPRASITTLLSGVTHPLPRATADHRGEATVRGVPFLRGETLLVTASDAHGRAGSATPVTLGNDWEGLDLAVDLPEEPNAAIGISHGGGVSFTSRSERSTATLGRAELRVSAFQSNGLPAAGALLQLSGPLSRRERADETGAVVFRNLPPGHYTVALREPGLVATAVDVDLSAGASQIISITEQPGRDASVVVRDEHGRPVPRVRLSVMLPWREAYVHLVDGTQDLDLLTDARGTFNLVNLPAVAVAVTATFGSRSASGTLSEATLELVLRK